MNSAWRVEIVAVLRKEFQSELRSKSGLTTGLLFSVVAAIAVSFSAYGVTLGGSIASGLFWVTMLFAAVAALPRTFVVEEEQGTGDLLRLMARPHAVFWGKSLFNLTQMTATGLLLSFLFLVLTDQTLKIPWLFAVSLFGGAASLAGAVTLCGALVAQASNRGALAGAISLPLMVPLIAFAVTGTQVSLGSYGYDGGVRAGFGLCCYAIATFALGPYLFAAVWKS